jgi:isopentenyl phosphate kinase
MIILKLGGSVLTDKSRPFSIRKKVIGRLAEEIRDSDKRVVVVHGGGAFGHPVASKHNLQEGLKKPSQILGVSKTRMAMEELNSQIVEIFISAGLPAVSMQTSAAFECEKRRIRRANLEIIKGFLKIGSIPVLYGDVVVDRLHKICILSGDQIVAYLARYLNPERVVLATNVDGVLNNKGEVIETINSDNAEAVLEGINTDEGDVTGGMRGKVEELLELSQQGISSFVINALEKDRVKNALLGKRTKGSLFEA